MLDWKQIWAALRAFISVLGLDKPDHWKAEVEDTHDKLTVTKVFINEHGIQFSVSGDPNGVTLIHATPNLAHLKYMDVEVNGKLDPNARMAFRLTGQPLKPVIVILTFRPIGGHRYRFDSPK